MLRERERERERERKQWSLDFMYFDHLQATIFICSLYFYLGVQMGEECWCGDEEGLKNSEMIKNQAECSHHCQKVDEFGMYMLLRVS
jgi:hypothetical protein